MRTEALHELMRGSKGRVRMAGGSALEIQLAATDHDGVIAELRAHLQGLAAA